MKYLSAVNQDLAEQSQLTSTVILAGLSKIFTRRIFGVSTGKVTHAVKDISLTLNKGKILALLGHNGAGKSTLINMVR